MATPTEPGHVDIRLAVSVHEDVRRALRPFLALVHRGVERGLVHDFRQDVAVWEHKRYLDRPQLVEGDGPIGAFRRWARQFSPRKVAA